MYTVKTVLMVAIIGLLILFAPASQASSFDNFELTESETLAGVVSQIGQDSNTIFIARNVVVDSDVNIPKNITLFFTPPGKLDVAANTTVTIVGIINAPAAQCFSGQGDIVIESGQPIYADWWGEDGQAIQKAINACSSGKVLLLDKVYETTSTITGKRGIVLQGVQSDEFLTTDTGSVIKYTGVTQNPVLDFRDQRYFGVVDLKISGNGVASHGLITGSEGMALRAKFSHIKNLVITDCGIGLDLGNTDDLSISNVIFQYCNKGVVGAHTNVGFYDCSFIENSVAGFQVETASKGSFYKCKWTGNAVDIIFSADPHPGSVYTFRDCWFENSTDTILRQAPLGVQTGIATLVFDKCILHTFGTCLMDLTNLGGYDSKIVFYNCNIPQATSSGSIVDPSGLIAIVGFPLPGITDSGAVLYQNILEEIIPGPPYLVADVTGPSGSPDGRVDMFDFALLASQWLEATP